MSLRPLRPFLLAAALALPAPALGAQLVLAFDELPPWKTHAKGKYGGAYTEIVRELAKRVGLELKIVDCPLKRCMLMLENGEADIIIGLKDTAERRRFLHFLSTPYRASSSDKVFYVPAGGGMPITQYNDLRSLRIGVKHGAGYFDRLDRDASLRKDAAKDMRVNFQKLMLGRLDTLVIPEDQGEALVAELDLVGKVAKASYRVTDPSPRYVALARNSAHAASIDKFERAMAAMARDGTLADLINRHYYGACRVSPASVSVR
jgi:polar amino acid transport system substrate-binding protein